MNKKELLLKRTEVWKSYHTPGMPNYAKRKKNAVFINSRNTAGHEVAKTIIGYQFRKNGQVQWSEKLTELMKEITKEVKQLNKGIKGTPSEFITEAVDNLTNKRRDAVGLDNHLIVEPESDKKRAARHEKGIMVVMVE